VRGIETYCDRIRASSVQKITNTILNEFGENSFSFISPDNYFWTLLEA
jgi:hypothetical protein